VLKRARPGGPRVCRLFVEAGLTVGGQGRARRGPRPAYIAARGWAEETAGNLLPALSTLLWWHDHASARLDAGGGVSGRAAFSASEHDTPPLLLPYDELPGESDAPAAVGPTEPVMGETLLEVEGLKKYFPIRRGLLRRVVEIWRPLS